MAQSLEQCTATERAYKIIVSGGREHGALEIIPPVNDENYAALMEEPRLSWASDFYLKRGDEKDRFWLGHEFNNGSSYGAHYERVCYFARVIASVLNTQGVSVSIATDAKFEASSARRLDEIHTANRRGF